MSGRMQECQGNCGRTVWLDHLTIAALAATLLMGVQPCHRLRYFEAGRSGRALAELLSAVGLLPPIEQVTSSVSDARGRDGASPFLAAYLAARRVCTRYVTAWVANDPVVVAVGGRFDPSLVQLHFDRLAEMQVRRECVRVALIRWLTSAQSGPTPTSAVLVLRNATWMSALREHVVAEGLSLMTYREAPDVSRMISAVGRHVRAARARLGRLGARRPWRDATRKGDLPLLGTAIGLQFGHRTLQSSALRRSEFFWLQGHSLGSRRLILLGAPAEVGSVAVGNSPVSLPMNVEVGAVAPPTPWRDLVGLVVALVLRPTVVSVVRGRKPSPYVWRHMISLLRDYLRWHAYFRSREIGVAVAPFASDATVGQVLALRDLGGISVGYQHSISNIVGPSAVLSPGVDVAFVSAEPFARLWNGLPARPTEIVPTGFIYDVAINVALRDAGWATARRRLLANGARFVITFFDENSVDGWESPFTNASASLDYEFLFQWLLEDPTLGLVLKPKKSINLHERVAPIARWIKTGLATGRCLVLTSDTLVGNVYPAEAAMMSDVVVGKLLGSTAAFEAWLAGRPTVLVDTEGFRDHPFWGPGGGSFVYADWPAVRLAIESYRRDPLANPGFGDWAPVADDLDPFRDGLASMRMRDHVFDLAEAIDRGLSRSHALEWAEARRRERLASPATP